MIKSVIFFDLLIVFFDVLIEPIKKLFFRNWLPWAHHKS